jgi:hypothetical protein
MNRFTAKISDLQKALGEPFSKLDFIEINLENT